MRQAAVWKRHQTILQNCADLSDICGVKILVDCCRFYLRTLLLLLINQWVPQFVMSIPPKPDGDQEHQGLLWDDSCDASATTGIHVRTRGCSTVIFDSFSSERDVWLRDTAKNRIGKLNDPERRFATDFSVRVSGEVTAILSARTVGNYRTTEKRGGGGGGQGCEVQANPLFLDSPPPLPQTFSSVIMNNITPPPPVAARAVVVDVPSAASSSASSINVSPHAVQLSPSDNELIASLAAATAAPASPAPQLPPPPPSMTWADALSTVVQQLATNSHSESCATNTTTTTTTNTPTSTTTTPSTQDRIDQLRKRCHNLLHQRNAVETHQKKQRVVSQRNHVQFQTVVFPVAAGEDDQAGGGTKKSDFFFSSVPRPKEVHQTLLDTAMQRRDKADQDSTPPIHTTAPTAPPAPEPTQPFGGSDSSAFTSITGRRSDSSSSFKASLLLPPMMPADDAFLAQEDHHQRHRLSSSDLIFTSMVCPVPLNGLLNLQDINFRHSSEEILAVSVLHDLRTKK